MPRLLRGEASRNFGARCSPSVLYGTHKRVSFFSLGILSIRQRLFSPRSRRACTRPHLFGTLFSLFSCCTLQDSLPCWVRGPNIFRVWLWGASFCTRGCNNQIREETHAFFLCIQLFLLSLFRSTRGKRGETGNERRRTNRTPEIAAHGPAFSLSFSRLFFFSPFDR